MAHERHDGGSSRGDTDGGMAGQGEHLTDLAEDINEQYRWHKVHADAARRHAQSAREHLERLSLMLLEAREGVAESADVEWGTWVEENLAFGLRQAQRYVKIGRALRDDATRVSRGSLRKGLASIDAPVDREKPRGHDALFSSESVEWYTPANIVAHVESALGSIDLDPCADPGMSIPAATHHTQTDDGLSKEWRGTVYMNPPYGRDVIGAWIEKLVAEYQSGRTTAAVALVPARTETGWFSLLDDYPRCFLRERVKFVSESGDAKGSATFPSAAFYLGGDVDAFVRAFEALGKVYTRWEPAHGMARSEDGEARAPRLPSPPRLGGVERPMLRYYGSKWNLAPFIAELFVDHRVFVEPYLGSAAVFMSKKPVRFEVLNDLDDEIVNLFEMIRTRREEMAGMVRLTPYSETEVRLAGETLGDGDAALDPAERARRFLVVSHQARRRQVGELSYSAATGPTARDNVSLWKRVPDNVWPVAERFRDADIRNRDAIEVVRANDHEDALVYADPPYVPGTRAPKLYRHETPLEHHERLVEALLDHPGPVYLSGYKNDLYERELEGRGWVARKMDDPPEGKEPEYLWLNAKAQVGAAKVDATSAKKKAEAEKRRRTPPPGMGMIYTPSEPEPEVKPEVALFGALIGAYLEEQE